MSTKQFTAQTFAWLRLLKGDRDTTALAVGVQMIEHFNEKDQGGRAFAGTDYMAELLGLSQSSVHRAVHRMHKRGRLKVIWGTQGRGHSNQYWMIVKDAPAHVSDPIKDAPEHDLKDAPAPLKHAPGHMNHSLSLREREGGRETPPPRACGAAGREEEFEDLIQLWKRPWGTKEAKALAAFNRLIGNGESPEIILDNARRWVAAREPRFLPALETWLDDGAWRNDPPSQLNGKHHNPSAAEVAANLAREARRNGR